MKFRDLNWKAVYRSDDDDIFRDFLRPLLLHTKRYDRAVGYFSRMVLAHASLGTSCILDLQTKMRLVIGAFVSDKDLAAVIHGYALRDGLISQLTSELLAEINQAEGELELVSALISSGALDIKIALRRQGIFHEKIGIAYDETGDFIVFQGSANETINAMDSQYNGEAINVFRSWISGDHAHYAPHLSSFEALWTGARENTLVVDMPHAIKERLIQLIKTKTQTTSWNEIDSKIWEQMKSQSICNKQATFDDPRLPRTPNGFQIRSYQQQALSEWKLNQYKGILDLATGAGKTKTAIYAATRIAITTKKLCLIVAVPYQVLADQWAAELRSFNFSPIICSGQSPGWQEAINRERLSFKIGIKSMICIVIVNASLKNDDFKRFYADISLEYPSNTMLIGDECHHLGTETIANCLISDTKYRLGLSATYEREFDHEGTKRIKQIFSKVVYQFDLKDAFAAGVLCPFEYHIIPVELDEDEYNLYNKLSRDISLEFAKTKDREQRDLQNSRLKTLLFARARLLGVAKNKVNNLIRIEEKNGSLGDYALVYCGSGNASSDEDSNGENRVVEKHVELVTNALRQRGHQVGCYTSATPKKERSELLYSFANGTLPVITAVQCLDEGVDIPRCENAYIMATARSRRQFVQRMGRVLRKADGKKMAKVFDFTVFPPANSSDIDKKLAIMELRRAYFFSRHAINEASCASEILTIAKNYDISFFEVHNTDQEEFENAIELNTDGQ